MIFGPVLMSGAYYCCSYMGNQYHSELFILVQVCEKVQIPKLKCQIVNQQALTFHSFAMRHVALKQLQETP